MPSILETKNLSKGYGKRTVVKSVNLSVRSGEIVGLLGPNGAGKTTTFYLIVGILFPDKGSILLDGIELAHRSLDKRARYGLGYLPQEASIFRELSVLDNLLAILELNSNLPSTKRVERAESLLEEFHLSHLRDSVGMVLSGGERRRVEIARLLATEPKFILLDEPFSGIDPISMYEIQGIILRLSQQGLGILITDHNVQATLRACHHAYIVNEGSVIAAGSPQEVLENPEVRAHYLGTAFNL